MALQGLQVLFVPARWPSARDDAWQTLLKARAIENQVFVVGCNAAGSEGGYSYAFDPLGRMIFSNRNKPPSPLQTFTFNPRRLMLARTLHNNLREAVLLRRT
jgi:predicted amidohydrolase